MLASTVSDIDLITLFQKGGFIMWPLLVCSVIASAVLLDRIVYFSHRRYRFAKTLEQIRAAAGQGAEAIEPDTSNPLLRFTRCYLENMDSADEHRRNVLRREASLLIRRAERRVPVLATIASLTPVIGLLGTVWGMVAAFAQIEVLERVKPADVAGGIWAALLTTVFGLVIAIPSLAATRWFESRTEKLARDLNVVASHLDEWTGHHTQ